MACCRPALAPFHLELAHRWRRPAVGQVQCDALETISLRWAVGTSSARAWTNPPAPFILNQRSGVLFTGYQQRNSIGIARLFGSGLV